MNIFNVYATVINSFPPWSGIDLVFCLERICGTSPFFHHKWIKNWLLRLILNQLHEGIFSLLIVSGVAEYLVLGLSARCFRLQSLAEKKRPAAASERAPFRKSFLRHSGARLRSILVVNESQRRPSAVRCVKTVVLPQVVFAFATLIFLVVSSVERFWKLPFVGMPVSVFVGIWLC